MAHDSDDGRPERPACRGRRSLAMGLAAALGFAAPPALARLDLPQVHLVINLEPAASAAVRDYFAGPDASKPLSPAVEKALIGSFPQNLREACADVISNWGDIARGSAVWTVRPLARQEGRVWLAFRCGSSVADYREFYDERLALLRPAAGTVEFFPLGGDFPNDSKLYHLEFAQTLRFAGAGGVLLRVLLPVRNPCCDGGDETTEERLAALADSPGGAAQAGSFVTLKDTVSSDDTDGDTETTYKAEVKFERNTQGEVTGVTAAFTNENFEFDYSTGKSQKRLTKKTSGVSRFRWNPATLMFDEIR